MDENKSETGGSGCLGWIVLGIVAFVIYGVYVESANEKGGSDDPSITNIVELGWRKSLLASGTGVLQIKNISNNTTPSIWVSYKNNDSDNTDDYEVGSLDTDEMEEVGILESGWVIEPNEVITVYADGYKSKSLYSYEDSKGELKISGSYIGKKANQAGDVLEKIFE